MRYIDADGRDQYERAFFASVDGFAGDERSTIYAMYAFWRIAGWQESYSFARMPRWLRPYWWDERWDCYAETREGHAADELGAA